MTSGFTIIILRFLYGALLNIRPVDISGGEERYGKRLVRPGLVGCTNQHGAVTEAGMFLQEGGKIGKSWRKSHWMSSDWL